MANVVVHGGGHGTIDVERLADRLLLRVTDQGPGIPRRRRVARHRPRPGRIGASGLWLARRLCERIDIQSGPGGTTVLLTCALSPHDE
jgi:serine/threonine-protein kinase RsbW